MNKPNPEVQRFVDHVGGNTPASKIFGCTPDMVRKLKVGERECRPKYARTMYKHKGFRLNWARLHFC